MVERRRGHIVGRIVLGVLLVVVVALVGAYWYARPLLLTGTGYAAHNACALQFVADRSDHATDLPPNPLVPYLRVEIDDDGSASAAVFGLLARQTAWFTDGFGCTIADERPDLPAATPVDDAAPLLGVSAPDADAALESALDAAFADGLGTRAVVVLRDGELVAERYAEGVDAETPQLGWSMAKSVTNLVVGRLVHEGRFDIHETGLRPEWAGEERDAITADHLMRMTSGLAWDETYDLGTPITRMLYLEDDMGGFAASLELVHPVGEYLQYSSGSTNILCGTVADRLGADANLPRDELLAPLGLTRAVWEPDAAGVPVCSSYLWATPREWAVIGQFALDDGVIGGRRLLPEGWIEASMTPTEAETEETTAYGAGWWLADDGSSFAAHGHDGQRLVVVPDEGLVVVRLGFSPGIPGDELGVDELVQAIIDMPRP